MTMTVQSMPQCLDTVENGFNRLNLALAAVAAILIGLITVLIPLNLVLVSLRWGSMWWLYEAVEYALYVGVFIGAPRVLHLGAHVRVDVLVSALPPAVAIRLEQAVDAFAALLCLTLCYYGTRAALSEFDYGTLPDKDLRIDNWYMLTVFAASFLLLAIEFLFRIRRASRTGDDDGGIPVSPGL